MTRADDLAEALVVLIRDFGIHEPGRTPCGFDASVAEAHALAELSTGPMRQMDLGDLLGLSKSTTSRTITSLVSRGWVKRQADNTDGRGIVLVLTTDGENATSRLREQRRNRMESLLEHVSPSEQDQVLQSLHLLQDAVARTEKLALSASGEGQQ